MMKLSQRSLLSGAAAAGLVGVAPAQDGAATAPFALGPEGGRAGSPWLIRGKVPITVKVSGGDVAGVYALLEVDTPAGRGPELHVHLKQNEVFYILAGKIGLQCGKEQHVLGVGETFMVPMNTPHAYVTLGTETARILNLFNPAGKIDEFFDGYVKLLNTDGPPDMARMKDLNERTGTRIVGPPLKAAAFTA